MKLIKVTKVMKTMKAVIVRNIRNGEQRHHPVPASDLAPVAAVVRRVDRAPGPGPGDMGGGRPAVDHGADAARGYRREGLLPPPGVSVDRPAGTVHVRVTAGAGMAVHLVRPVGGVARVPDGDGEVVAAGPVLVGDGRGQEGAGTAGTGLGVRAGMRGGGHGDERGEGRGRDEGKTPDSAYSPGSADLVDLQHDLTNAPRLRMLRTGKGFALRPACLVPWEAIGDTALDCVIIWTHHSRSRERLCWRRRLVRSMAPHC